MSPFRRDLEKAAKDVKKLAQQNADDYSSEFGKRLGDKTRGQWSKIMDAAFTGSHVDWDKVIGAFDSKNLDEARDKIHQFLGEMEEVGKLQGPDGSMYDKLIKSTNDAIDAQQNLNDVLAQQKDTEAALSDFRKQWNKKYLNDLNEAHRLDKLYADDAVRYSKMWRDQFTADLNAAITENDAWHSRRRKTMEEAMRDNEAFNRSFNGMVKNVQRGDLERDFNHIADAWSRMDFSTMLRNAGGDFDRLRDRVSHVVGSMEQMGRVNRGNSFEITADLEDWIRGQDQVTERVRETTREGGRLHSRMSRVGAVFGSLFRASKGFREHLGGFAGINVFGDMIRDGLDFIEHNLDRIALKAAVTTTKLATMASVGGSAFGSLVTVLADLGPIIGGLGAVLPGFLIGAGIQAVVLQSALKDMKTVLKDLGPAFKKLQDSISAKFWKQAEDPIRNMVKKLLPTLTTNLNNTATSLGRLTGAFATALGNIHPQNITTMFDRMNKGIEIAKGAMKPLVSAFTILGLAASQYFERFGQWIVDLSNRFNNFITEASADGRLIGWIDAMIEGFKNIGRAIDGVFGIFNALDTAASAAGFGGLATFADNLQRIAAAMQSAGAQTALTQLWSGMLTLTQRLGEGLGKLGGPLASIIMPEIQAGLGAIGTAVSTVLGYVGQVLQNPLVQKGVIDFTTGIATAVAKLAPAVTPFANSLGNIMTLFSMILQNIANIVTAFTVQLAPVLDQMSLQFQTLVKPLGDAVVNLITALAPVAQSINDNLVGPIVAGIRDGIIPGFNSMVTALSPVAATMAAALGPVIQSLLPLIPKIFELATTIGTVLGGAVTALAPLFSVLVAALMPVVDGIVQLVNMIAPFLVPALASIAAAVSPVIAVLGQLIGFVLSILVPILGVLIIGIINNVVGVFQGLSNFIMGFVQVVTAIFTGFGAFFTKLFQGDIGGALQALGTMFAGIWDGIVKMLQGALEFLWNAVQLLFIGKLIGGIRTALMSMSGFFSSVWNAIVSFLRGAMGNISGTIMGGLNAVRGFFVAAWNGMLAIIRGAWSGITGAVSNGINGVMGWVRGLPGQISGALGNLGNLLVGAGRAIIDGFLSGLKSMWGAVTSFVGGIADWIAKNKGPIPYDRKLLVPAGEAIMFGLESSMRDKFGNVMDFVSSMADAMAGNFDKNRMYLMGADASQGLADGLLANKSKIKGAFSTLGQLSVADPSLGSIKRTATDGRTSDSSAAGPSLTLAEGAVQVITRASDPRLVAGTVTDALDDQFSKFSKM